MDASCNARHGMACHAHLGLPTVRRCGMDFQVFTIAPREPEGHWTLLGEVNKWVSVSSARVASISIEGGGQHERAYLSVWLKGEQGERVTVAFAPPLPHPGRRKDRIVTPHVLTCRLVDQRVEVRCQHGVSNGKRACECVQTRYTLSQIRSNEL